MTGIPFAEAIDFMRERLALGEDEWQALVRQVDGAARTRSVDMSRSMHRDVLAAVLDALEEGSSLGTFLERFDEIGTRHGWADDREWRKMLIFRNQIAAAQAAGRWRQIQRVRERRPWLRYVTAGDHRVRPAHAAWHNLVLHVDDPWWQTHYPPNGFNCRCHVQALSERDLVRFELEPGTAPPLNTVPKLVTQNGVPSLVEVPAGIDPGFAYNVGERGLSLPAAPASAPQPAWPTPPETEAEVTRLAMAIHREQADWVDDLSAAELDALGDYKSSGYQVINAALRGDPSALDDFDDIIIEGAEITGNTLSAALGKTRFPRNATVFRGVDERPRELFAALEPGAVFQEEGFLSASLSRQIGQRFGEYLIEIRVPQGTQATALVHFVPDVNHVEYEVLFDAGYRFRVIEQRANGILLEVISR